MSTDADWLSTLQQRAEERRRVSLQRQAARAADGDSRVQSSTPTHLPAWHGRRALDDLDTAGRFEQTREAIATARRWVDKFSSVGVQRGLHLWGDVGVGKTTVVCAIAVELGEPDGVTYWDSRELMKAMQAEWDAPERPRPRLEERVAKAPVLILDDLLRRHATRWQTDVARDVIERRHDRGLPTVFTSNLPPAGAESLLSPPSASRLEAMAHRVKIEGVDLRGEG